jgi:hypothetical protein
MAEVSLVGRRMIEDMTIRNLSSGTQRSYTRWQSSVGILPLAGP